MRNQKQLLLVIVLSILSSGCSTIKGVGDDLKTVGGWISNSSEHVKESIRNNPPKSKLLSNQNKKSLPDPKTDFLINME